METEGRKAIQDGQVALFHRGESIVNLYSKDGAELLVLGGQPLNEPVFSYGPFVTNTKEEMQQVINDYQTGKMGDPDVVNAR